MSIQLKHYYRKRAEMIQILGGKCADCGTTANLEFDHKDRSTKAFNISKMYGYSMDTLKDELAKCQLLCKDCHLIKTKEVDGLKSVHGKNSMYVHHKCRCSLCTEAHRIAIANTRAKKK